MMRASILVAGLALLSSLAPKTDHLEVVLPIGKSAAMERVIGAFASEGITAKGVDNGVFTSQPVHMKILIVDDLITFRATLFSVDSTTHVLLTVTHRDVGTGDIVANMNHGVRQESVEQEETIDSKTQGKLHGYWNQMQRVATRLQAAIS